MIRAIIFDLGGVIVPLDFPRGYARMEELCGCPAGDIPARIAGTDLVRRFECGEIEPREFAGRFCELLDLRLDYDAFRELWSAIFPPWTLISEPLLAALGARYRLLLLSNTNALHFGFIRERYPLLGHFHDYVLSYEVGAMKPAPRIYQEAIARAGCDAGECFFTDDVAAYVDGACNEGIDAVQFESAERLERDLRARGVEW